MWMKKKNACIRRNREGEKMEVKNMQIGEKYLGMHNLEEYKQQWRIQVPAQLKENY